MKDKFCKIQISIILE